MEPDASSASVFAPTGRHRRSGVPAIILDGYVSASAVEDRIAQADAPTWESPLLYIDLTRALHFDAVGLLRLLSIVAERRTSNRHTMVDLPNDNLARHILRLWDFPKAVAAVARAPFRLLVEPGDLEHFGEEWPLPPMRLRKDSSPDSVLAYLVERRSFGFTVYREGADPRLDRLVPDQVAHWSGYALANLLSALLPAPPADFARVVVRELLVNALKGTSPSIVVVASQLDLLAHEEASAPAGLSIGVWHDGEATTGRFSSACGRREPAGPADSASGGIRADPGVTALCRTGVATFGGSVTARGGGRGVVIGPRSHGGLSVRPLPEQPPVFGDLVWVRIPIPIDNG